MEEILADEKTQLRGKKPKYTAMILDQILSPKIIIIKPLVGVLLYTGF